MKVSFVIIILRTIKCYISILKISLDLRDELEKIQKEENYKFFTARFSDHINLNQGIREIAKRPVQIMLGNVKSVRLS